MNKEEKKAIEEFKDLHCGDYFCDVILNLIEKQQREIKGKEALIDTLEHNDIVYQDVIREYEKDFISKDKIKKKIKEYEEHCVTHYDEHAVNVLLELLEENE